MAAQFHSICSIKGVLRRAAEFRNKPQQISPVPPGIAGLLPVFHCERNAIGRDANEPRRAAHTCADVSRSVGKWLNMGSREPELSAPISLSSSGLKGFVCHETRRHYYNNNNEN